MGNEAGSTINKSATFKLCRYHNSNVSIIEGVIATMCRSCRYHSNNVSVMQVT